MVRARDRAPWVGAYAREVEALKIVAKERIEAGQAELDLGLEVAEAASSGGPLEITGSRVGHLWDALCRAYDALGFHDVTGGDDVFRQLVLARIIEPTSKEDSVRVLEEVGVNATSYPTIKRRLPDYAEAEDPLPPDLRDALAQID